MDEQRLAQMFRQAKGADRMRVPPMRAIVARAEYARELQARRRLTAVMGMFSGAIAAGACALILLAPRALLLPMSPGITPLLLLVAAIMLWGTGDRPTRIGSLSANASSPLA